MQRLRPRERWIGRTVVLATIGLAAFVWFFPQSFGDPGEVRVIVVTVLVSVASLPFAWLAIVQLTKEAGLEIRRSFWRGHRTLTIVRWPEVEEEGPRTLTDEKERGPLTSFQLSGVYLPGAPLVGVDLTGTDLTEAVLRGADLNSASLRRANLQEADLGSSDIRMATLSKSSLVFASLRNARLDGADLRGADLRGADLSGASLNGAVYDSATIWPWDVESPNKLGAVDIDKEKR